MAENNNCVAPALAALQSLEMAKKESNVEVVDGEGSQNLLTDDSAMTETEKIEGKLVSSDEVLSELTQETGNNLPEIMAEDNNCVAPALTAQDIEMAKNETNKSNIEFVDGEGPQTVMINHATAQTEEIGEKLVSANEILPDLTQGTEYNLPEVTLRKRTGFVEDVKGLEEQQGNREERNQQIEPETTISDQSTNAQAVGQDELNVIQVEGPQQPENGTARNDTFTVSQAIDALGFGKFQVMLSLFTGLCWMADSMEMMILSILAPALHCEWCISKYEQASLTLAVFAGMMISSPVWGILSDRYGRRLALWVSVGILFFYGTVSSFSPSYFWLIFFRFFVGFAIGCVPQSVTLYAEFLPTKQRARCVILLDCFWALGACLEVLLALLVMPTLGWQWLLGLSALPILLFFIMCYWLPESVRYLATSGETEKAMTTLKRIADDNGRPMLLGRLIVDDMHQMERGRFKDLLMPEMRKTTLLLWFIWMSCAFCYYGVVLMSTQILKQFDEEASKAQHLLNLTETLNFTQIFNMTTTSTTPSALIDFGNTTCDPTKCTQLSTSDYVDLLWITLAEFPGILVTIFVLDRIGRKKTMGAQFILFAVTIAVFIFPIHDRAFMTVILFFARGIVSGVFQAAYVYTPEVYPTSMRAIGIGTCSSMARFGAMATPYIAQVLLETSRPLAVTLYACVALLAACLSILLPIETKGKEMPDRVTKS